MVDFRRQPAPRRKDIDAQLYDIETAGGRLDRHVEPPPRPSRDLNALTVHVEHQPQLSGRVEAAHTLANVLLGLAGFVVGLVLLALLLGNLDGMSGAGAWFTRHVGAPPFVVLLLGVGVVGAAATAKRLRAK